VTDAFDPATTANASAARSALSQSHAHLPSYLQRRLGSSEEASDVMQSSMLRAMERADDLRDVRTIRGWRSRLLAISLANH
jgi:DNA-directed RNA polymerase specialized sigma24 family protein